jgi:hypothetical protein
VTARVVKRTAILQTVVAVLAVGSVITAVAVLNGCQQLKDAQPTINAACTLVSALADDAVPHAVCATEQEIATLVDAIRTVRADAGRKGVRECRVIPTTTTCATEREIAYGIDAVLVRRSAR